jgi:TM2 domain-containing membrane protein YozV
MKLTDIQLIFAPVLSQNDHFLEVTYMNNAMLSYLLWCGCFFGFCGLHRIYNRKIISGIFWFCTLGIFGIGQVIDLVLIPGMVDEYNYKVRRKLGLSEQGVPLNYNVNPTLVDSQHSPKNPPKKLSEDEIMVTLAKVAAKKGGRLSLNEAVVETSLTFEQVEKAINIMLIKGYAIVDNDPKTGAVIYYFR